MAWYGLVWWDAWGTMVKRIHFLKQCVWFSLIWPTCQDFLIPLRHLSKIQCRIVFFVHARWSDFFWKCQKPSGNTLVGGIPTPLKNMSSSIGIIVHNIWKNMFQTTNQHGTVCRTVPHVGQSQPSWDCWRWGFCKCDNREPKERVAWNSLIFLF